MKILNAKTFFPKQKAKVNDKISLPLDDCRPQFSSEALALDVALPVCKTVLEEINFDPLAIDLILNITITPDRLFKDKTIGVPRIAHPIHHYIKAENAYVLDIHDSDWNSAFGIAKAYMTDTDKKNVLIIRSELLHHSVHPDYHSGFNIADGVAVVLAQKDTDSININYKNLETSNVFARYDMLPKGPQLAQGQYRSKLTFEADETYIDDLNTTGTHFLNHILEENEVDGVIFESWFPMHRVQASTQKIFKSTREHEAFKSLGTYSLPYFYKELKKDKTLSTLCHISYSPFLNRYSSAILSI